MIRLRGIELLLKNKATTTSIKIGIVKNKSAIEMLLRDTNCFEKGRKILVP